IEFAAERNEKLLNLYLKENYCKKIWINQMKQMIKENEIYICACGSALNDEGIKEFMYILHRLTITNYNDGEFKGRIYKIAHDKNGNKISHIKILSGNLKVKDELTYKCVDEKISEKINQIRIYNSNKYETANYAQAGQLIGVTGLDNSRAGQGLGNVENKVDYNMIPTLRSKAIFDSSMNVNEVIKAFNMLNEEDPSLKVDWNEELQEIHIQVMGAVQLEILEKIIRDRFDLSVEFGEPGIIYKETIKDTVCGYGHYEPLRHYAEVHLKIEAGARNGGIVFENLCHIDDLARGHQNLIKQYILEGDHKGLLTGSSLTDVKITLLTGRAHNKHTSGGDFREATSRALRQGLEKADNILLEPYYNFKIKIDSDNMGKVLSDIEKASGAFAPPETVGKKFIIRGSVPVSTFMNYPTKLAAFTGGKGVINLSFGGYDVCHNEDDVIEDINYDKNADMENSSSSVFCSKGQSYIVPWYEAEDKMHCL
ncbi:MAG: elongation factor G, partial [bacterium]